MIQLRQALLHTPDIQIFSFRRVELELISSYWARFYVVVVAGSAPINFPTAQGCQQVG
jgi:hypothetical protein